MRIGARLITGFMVIVFFIWIVTLFTFKTFDNIHEKFELFGTEIVSDTIEMGNMETAVLQLHIYIMEYILHNELKSKEKIKSSIEFLNNISYTHVAQSVNKSSDKIVNRNLFRFYFSFSH